MQFPQGFWAGQGAPLPELRAEVLSRRYQRPQMGLPEVTAGENVGHGHVRHVGVADCPQREGWKPDGVAGGESSRELPGKVSGVWTQANGQTEETREGATRCTLWVCPERACQGQSQGLNSGFPRPTRCFHLHGMEPMSPM